MLRSLPSPPGALAISVVETCGYKLGPESFCPWLPGWETCESREARNVFRYHLGSLAFGSFIIAVIQFIRYLMKYYETLHGKWSLDGTCQLDFRSSAPEEAGQGCEEPGTSFGPQSVAVLYMVL